jgi:HD-like signal output (HDOD) protein
MKGLGDWVRSLSTRDLPVLRSSVDALDRMRKDEDAVTARDLADVILRDPLLAARVLRYSQARLTSRQPTEVTTVEHAIMMHGVTPFFRQFRDLPTLEDALRGHPRALRGALGVISRAYHAATNARHFAALRHDLEGDEVMLSALLHDLAELLLWWVAPEAAMQIERMLASVRGLRSHAAQRVVLGFTLDELQLELAREWRLPRLLQALMDVRQASTYRVRTVQLSLAVARHSAHGWYDPGLAGDYVGLHNLLSLPIDQVVRRVRHCALQAARGWRLIGVSPAAAWLPMAPGDWPVEPATMPVTPDSAATARVLDQFAYAQQHPADRSALVALLVYGLEIGLGVERAWIGRLDHNAGQVRTLHATRASTDAEPVDLSFAIGEGGLFDRLLDRTQALWCAPDSNANALGLVPAPLRARVGAGGFYCMSLALHGRDALLVYADARDSRLDDTRYNAFKQLCGAARAALLNAASVVTPRATS